MNKPIHYEVTNRVTGKVTVYKTAKAARAASDKINNAYGEHISSARAVLSS